MSKKRDVSAAATVCLAAYKQQNFCAHITITAAAIKCKRPVVFKMMGRPVCIVLACEKGLKG